MKFEKNLQQADILLYLDFWFCEFIGYNLFSAGSIFTILWLWIYLSIYINIYIASSVSFIFAKKIWIINKTKSKTKIETFSRTRFWIFKTTTNDHGTRNFSKETFLFFKIIKNPSSKFQLIPTARQAYMIRYKSINPFFIIKHDCLKIASSLQL